MAAILFGTHYIKWVNKDKEALNLAETKALRQYTETVLPV